MITKLKKNLLYNIAYQLLNLCLPIMTVPYVSRTLGVEGNGIYSYTYSIVNYFMIFAMLGISNYGNRTIAKNKDKKEQLSKEFLSIYRLQFIFTAISIIIYILYCIFISEYFIISVIEVIFLLSTLLDISWLYFGLEEFKKTVTRNILVKVISLALIFIFVKSKNDLYLYTAIMALSSLISQLVLWVSIKKYIIFKGLKLNNKDIRKHIKGIIILFIPVISYSIYKIMGKIMIGLLSSVEEVAYYEYAEKIINIPIGFITALGTVMLPKISNLVANMEFEKVKDYLFKAIKFIIFLAIPCFLGLVAIGSEFAVFFLGDEYSHSGNLIKLLAFTIPFTAWANVIRTQWLIPKENDNIYISTTILGALLNLVINVILIPKFAALGACIATVCSEVLITILQSFLSRKEINFKIFLKPVLYFIFSGLIMFISIQFIGQFIENNLVMIIVEVILGVTIYSSLNLKYITEVLLSKRKQNS